ncbi:MAG: DMT family transporter, partial [Nocardioides sp.]|nr:DMT family transporter [Nocardioides sp.]
MTTLTHDATPVAASRFGVGLVFALVSAASFGLSGALARGLLDAGWTAGAAVTVRVSIAAFVLAVPSALALRSRWAMLRSNASTLLVYGVAAVAGCQLCYFYAVEHMQVGLALLIEYTAPVAVVVWLWLRHGHRPGRLTLVGAFVSAVGLILVLDVFSGAQVSVVGVLWALGAMVGVTFYFVISADEDNGLPPMVLAGGGLVIASLVLTAAGTVGILPMAVSSADVSYRGTVVPWWVPVLG